jgi:hypothetical protein
MAVAQKLAVERFEVFVAGNHFSACGYDPT